MAITQGNIINASDLSSFIQIESGNWNGIYNNNNTNNVVTIQCNKPIKLLIITSSFITEPKYAILYFFKPPTTTPIIIIDSQASNHNETQNPSVAWAENNKTVTIAGNLIYGFNNSSYYYNWIAFV